MKKTNILYWLFTGLFAFMMLGSAIPDIFSVEIARKGFHDIQLPAYLLPFLGIAKALGVLAILVPGYPRLKEWAYAGLVIDLVGATYCIISAGRGPENWVPMALPLALAAASYVFYHRRLKQRAARSGYEEVPATAVLGARA